MKFALKTSRDPLEREKVKIHRDPRTQAMALWLKTARERVELAKPAGIVEDGTTAVPDPRQACRAWEPWSGLKSLQPCQAERGIL